MSFMSRGKTAPESPPRGNGRACKTIAPEPQGKTGRGLWQRFGFGKHCEAQPQNAFRADRPLPNQFAYTQLSLRGGSHEGRFGEPSESQNQDACGCHAEDKWMLGLVCDGVGECPHSEYGARKGILLLQRHSFELASDMEGLWQDISCKPYEAAQRFVNELQRRVLSQLDISMRQLVPRTPPSDRQTQMFGECLMDYLLFTVIGALVTPRFTALFSCGDGGYVLNGKSRCLRAGNAPPCLAYNLWSGSDPEGSAQNRLVLQEVLPTSELDHLVICTDGVGKITWGMQRCCSGLDLLGALAASDHPLDARSMRHALSMIGRPRFKIDQNRGNGAAERMQRRFSGSLYDDTTAVVIRRKAKEERYA